MNYQEYTLSLTIHISAGESHHSGHILVDEIVSNNSTSLRVCDDDESLQEKNAVHPFSMCIRCTNYEVAMMLQLFHSVIVL